MIISITTESALNIVRHRRYEDQHSRRTWVSEQEETLKYFKSKLTRAKQGVPNLGVCEWFGGLRCVYASTLPTSNSHSIQPDRACLKSQPRITYTRFDKVFARSKQTSRSLVYVGTFCFVHFYYPDDRRL